MTANPAGQPLSLDLPAGHYYELSGPLPAVTGYNLTLASDGVGATIDARSLSRLFAVADGAALVLRQITLLNGFAVSAPAGRNLSEAQSLPGGGEAACENHGFTQSECSAVGCCQWEFGLYAAGGTCRSAVGQSSCSSSEGSGGWSLFGIGSASTTGSTSTAEASRRAGGGALYVESGSLVQLEGCAIVDCASEAESVGGGGILVSGGSEVHLTDSNISNSLASGNDVLGGFLYLAAGSGGAVNQARLTRCTITNSSARVTQSSGSGGLLGLLGIGLSAVTGARGGCLYFGSQSVAQLVGCIISITSVIDVSPNGIASFGSLEGGMLYMTTTSPVRFTDCSIAHSTAEDVDTFTYSLHGGAFYVHASVLHLTACHIAHSEARGGWDTQGGAFYVLSEQTSSFSGIDVIRGVIKGVLHLTDSVITDSAGISSPRRISDFFGSIFEGVDIGGVAYGGALSSTGGDIHLTRCAIRRSSTHSVSASFGGAISLQALSLELSGTSTVSITTAPVAHLTECIISDSVGSTSESGFVGSAGGALASTEGVVHIVDCTIVNGSATEGGGLYTVGSASFNVIGTAVTQCRAERGGGLHVGSGTATLGNGTRFYGNVAAQGSSYAITTGDISYTLPVAPAHWLPNGRCEVFRESCPVIQDTNTGQSFADPNCLSVFDACKLTPDNVNGESPSVGNQQCTLKKFVQPCDWLSQPELLGQPIYSSPNLAEDQDFPFPCPPGILGSSNSNEQTSSLCAGLCPAGNREQQFDPAPRAHQAHAKHPHARQVHAKHPTLTQPHTCPLHASIARYSEKALSSLTFRSLPDGRDRDACRVRAGQVLYCGIRRRDPVQFGLIFEFYQPHERRRVQPHSAGSLQPHW